ncbi:AAA domain-containing protein, putative AbiEii toxin, Type IV TA system [Novosphingobium sp. B1]|nr:AAA domain-containing protein, putative AbiEii toxin, Type IV TA system [Novosphingobium sp. B1]
MRKAWSRKAEFVSGPNGKVYGYVVDLRSAFIAEENVYYDYHDDEPATIKFFLDNGHTLTLYFPEQGECYLIADAQGKACNSPSSFRAQFKCKIGFAPVLSPVDHRERLYQAEAARLALLNYQASRNFRNIWHHFPAKFDQFKDLVELTWPGMSVTKPEIGKISGEKDVFLFMYCPEKRRPREIFWSGFGFQVWCQMLTHIVQSSDASIFLIDEPDVYLHSDLQRQLVSILKDIGPDIVLATHSTEIISECEADEITIISKDFPRAKRLRSPTELGAVFSLLGSSVNPILTQLAKTRRALFVEGLDFKILAQFARKVGRKRVAVRSDFAVVPTDGFNPEKIKSLKLGMEHPLGRSIISGAILDRDYRSDPECAATISDLERVCNFAIIHERKELENFVLIPPVIDRLVQKKIAERRLRGASISMADFSAAEVLEEFAREKKTYIMAQFTEKYKTFLRREGERDHEAKVLEAVLGAFETRWSDPMQRIKMVPGKEALSFVNGKVQRDYKVSITPSAIIEEMKVDEVPADMCDLIDKVYNFSLEKF